MAEQQAAGAQRVALLARPGKAADNLAEALRQAGADLVLVADPNSLDAQRLLEARAQAVLVALEPGVEHAIDRLDPVLSAPELTVIFDEADLAAHRAGWDAARWVRHLSAKLHHHERVLPPGGEAETEEWYPSPGQLPKPGAAFADINLDAFAEEAATRAEAVPSDAMRFEAFVQEAAQITGVSPESAPPAPAAASAEPEASLRPPPAPAAPVAPTAPFAAAVPAAPVPPAAPVAAPAAASAFAALSLEPLPEIGSQAEPQAEPAGFQDASEAIEISFDTFVFDDALPSDSLQADSLQADGLLTIEEDFAPEAPAPAAPAQAQAASDDDGGLELMPEIESSEIEPIRFDDDAFFLEELSADAGKAPPAEASPVFGFDTLLAFDAPAPAPAERRDFDLDVVDLSFEEIAAEPASPPAPAQDQATGQPTGLSLDSFGGLSLVDDDTPLSPPPRQDTSKHDLSALESRISSLSLVEIEPSEPETAASEFAPEPAIAIPSAPIAAAPSANVPREVVAEAAAPTLPPPLPASAAGWAPAHTVAPAPPVASSPHPASRGIVLIEAGLGGPDPVRQVLAGLPASFAMPVLVRLHLQGGRYDRLVTQMERAASLPVMLAEAGRMVHSGCIYFLPDGVGLLARADGMQFIAHPSPAATIFAALPAEDSAVIFLSGSDSALIDDAMQAAEAGALLIAQSPEDCYDGAACAYLRSRGAPSALPGELAQRLLSRWG